MLVSVIIPVYQNHHDYLKDAIKSVEQQTYPHVELIIVEGKKTVGQNMNDGIARSRGGFIKKLDYDDMLTPNSIADSVNGMQYYDFVYGNAINWEYYTGKETLYRYGPTRLDDMLTVNRIHGGTIMYRRRLFDDPVINGYDPELITAEEYDLNLKLMYNGYKGNYIDKSLYIYRIHNRNKSMVRYIGLHNRRDYVDEIRKRYV
ncbi:MAG: glycosyltransferase [Candidatus Paceibacterota bacterium]|jgi:glycosyltransferase involved in cell wall biosynthesis